MLRCIIFTTLLLSLPPILLAQQRTTSRLKDRINTRLQATSNTVEATTAILRPAILPTQATVRLTTNSLSVSKTDSTAAVTVNRSKSGIDTIIVFQAQDSMRYFVRDRHLRLRGNAFVKNRAQTLQAEVIDVFFDKGYMKAETARDSLGRVYGVPKFTDGKESYYGATLSYNFRTQRGTISLAETKMGEGFFFGERVKRVGEDTFYMQDGCYTTCDKTHPHFFFKSSKMKVVAKDKIFADFLTFYIEDVPLLAMPFGVFMELGGETGRRSGVLIPQVFVASPIGSTTGRGIAFENFGYYFAINDNLDAKVMASFYTKGGILGRVQGNYVFGKRFRGSVEGSYGRVRFSPTEEESEQWSFALNHNQELTPFTSIQGSLNFSSPGYNRATQSNLNQRVQQTLNSNFSINHRFDNGIPLGLGYSRVQNLATNEVSQNVRFNTSVPQLFPFKNLVPRDSWLADVTISYGVSATVDSLKPAETIDGETKEQRTQRIANLQNQTFRARVQHSPSINISPRLGYFTITPSIGYRENWYFRRIFERKLTGFTTGTISKDSIENGFFREYAADFGLSVGTTLYGVVNPRILGINSLRHTLRPTLGISFSPNVGDTTLGMVQYVRSSTGSIIFDNGQPRTYSRYQYDGGSTVVGQVAALTWGLSNNFEAKIAESDTSDKVVQLLALNASGSVNFAASEFQWSPIGVGFSNTLGGVVQFSGNAMFDVYGQGIDSVTTPGSRFYKRVDEFLINRKDSTRGLVRLTNAGFTLSYAVGSSGGVPAGAQTMARGAEGDTTSGGRQSSEDAALGARFQQRMDNTYDRVDLYGDQTPGSRPLDVSWNSSYNAAFSYSPKTTPNGADTWSALIATQFSVTLEKSWRLSTGFSYDVISGAFNAPSLSLNKDLHCWEMSLTWNPVGQSQGFMFRIGMKAAQLRDIQYTRRESPLFRQ